METSSPAIICKYILRLGRCLPGHSFAILTTLLLIVPLPTLAGAGHFSGFDGPIDFSLSLSNSDIDLRTANRSTPVSLNRVSISIFSFADPQLQFGFITGSSEISISNDPLTAGLNLSGYHAGLALRSVYGHNPQIGFQAHYLYQENKTTSQNVTLSWYEWSAGLTGEIILGQQLGIIAGLAYNDIKAQRRATGNINETREMTLSAGVQGRLGLEWLMATGGRVSLSLQQGSYRQIKFTFARKFK